MKNISSYLGAAGVLVWLIVCVCVWVPGFALSLIGRALSWPYNRTSDWLQESIEHIERGEMMP